MYVRFEHFKSIDCVGLWPLVGVESVTIGIVEGALDFQVDFDIIYRIIRLQSSVTNATANVCAAGYR